jgi:hypothetical protein
MRNPETVVLYAGDYFENGKVEVSTRLINLIDKITEIRGSEGFQVERSN